LIIEVPRGDISTLAYVEYKKKWKKKIDETQKGLLIWDRFSLPEIPLELTETNVESYVRELTPYRRRAGIRPLRWLSLLLRFILTFLPLMLVPVCQYNYESDSIEKIKRITTFVSEVRDSRFYQIALVVLGVLTVIISLGLCISLYDASAGLNLFMIVFLLLTFGAYCLWIMFLNLVGFGFLLIFYYIGASLSMLVVVGLRQKDRFHAYLSWFYVSVPYF